MTASKHTQHYGLSQYEETGLTATQLDAPTSDDYNSVRVDMPARSIESEEPHHE
jgi:hypothetical protein